MDHRELDFQLLKLFKVEKENSLPILLKFGILFYINLPTLAVTSLFVSKFGFFSTAVLGLLGATSLVNIILFKALNKLIRPENKKFNFKFKN